MDGEFVKEVGAEQNELSVVAACVGQDMVAIESDGLGFGRALSRLRGCLIHCAIPVEVRRRLLSREPDLFGGCLPKWVIGRLGGKLECEGGKGRMFAQAKAEHWSEDREPVA
jgi:hypothetical protein